LGLAGGGLALVTAGCATNPQTGREQLIVVSDDALQNLSLQAWNDLKAKTPLVSDSRLSARVTNVGRKIAAAAGADAARWEFATFDQPQINAFVLPGGKVGVYRGLLELCDNDGQLAAVLGHEAAHVTGRHAAERMSRALLAQGGLQVAALGATRLPVEAGARQAILQALGVGVQYGVLLPFSREQELEADVIGLRHAARAGYDPREALTLWRKMAAAGPAKPPEFLSTHPSDANRIARLSEQLRAMGYQT
jgi:predicted Zn-dependent protease